MQSNLVQDSLQDNRNYRNYTGAESQQSLQCSRTYRNYPAPNSAQQTPATKIYALVEFKRGRTVQFQSHFFSQPGMRMFQPQPIPCIWRGFVLHQQLHATLIFRV